MSVHDAVPIVSPVVVAVDVGKNAVAVSVTDAARRRAVGAGRFPDDPHGSGCDAGPDSEGGRVGLLDSGRCGGCGALPPADAEAGRLAGGLGVARRPTLLTSPSSGGSRAGGGSRPSDRPGGDHRVGAGRSGHHGLRARAGDRGAGRSPNTATGASWTTCWLRSLASMPMLTQAASPPRPISRTSRWLRPSTVSGTESPSCALCSSPPAARHVVPNTCRRTDARSCCGGVR